MRTLDLVEAAKFLHMSPSALRQKAQSGKVIAAKPGKRWVFLETDLVAYLQSLYHASGRAPLSGCKEETLWHFSNAVIPGGSASQPQMESEYAALLGLKTGSRLRNITTG